MIGTVWNGGSIRAAGSIAVLAGAGFVSACGTDVGGPSLLDAQVDETAAYAAADALLEDLAVMGAVAPGSALGAPGAGPGGMGERGDLIRDRTVTYFDGGGVEQDDYDPLTTASIHTVVTVSGEIARDGFSASVERNRDLLVTGLEGEETERTWNGTGSESHTRSRVSDGRGTRSYSLVGTSEIDDVVRAVDRETQPWPLSGTIRRTVVVTIEGRPGGDVTRERTTVVTFNGTQFVTMTVNGEEFEVDLGARERERPVRRRVVGGPGGG